MSEEVVDNYELHMVCYDGGDSGDDDRRVMEWESGLPGVDKLTPLSQPLVPPGLATAFRIPPEPGQTLLDVHRASAATVSRLQRAPSSSSGSGGSGSSFAPFQPHAEPRGTKARWRATTAPGVEGCGGAGVWEQEEDLDDKPCGDDGPVSPLGR